MNILETQRLILRDFETDDLDELYNLVYADPQVKLTWSSITGTPEEIKKRFNERYISPHSRFGLKAIVIKETSQLIGLMGFQIHQRAEGKAISYLLTKEAPHRMVNNNPDCLEVELTYALGQAFWKKGYALEMGKAMVIYGFKTLNIGRIIQGVLSYNESSINLMRRLSFRIEQGLDGKNVVGILDKTDLFPMDESLNLNPKREKPKVRR